MFLDKEEKSKSHKITFLDILTILFIGLKLGKVIEWSWFWVLSPILIPLILVVVCIFLIGAIVTVETVKVKRGRC